MLDVRLHVGAATQPTDDRPMPEGCWRRCRGCERGEVVRSRTVLSLPDGWVVSEPAGVGVCQVCSGTRRTRF